MTINAELDSSFLSDPYIFQRARTNGDVSQRVDLAASELSEGGPHIDRNRLDCECFEGGVDGRKFKNPISDTLEILRASLRAFIEENLGRSPKFGFNAGTQAPANLENVYAATKNAVNTFQSIFDFAPNDAKETIELKIYLLGLNKELKEFLSYLSDFDLKNGLNESEVKDVLANCKEIERFTSIHILQQVAAQHGFAIG